MPRRVKPKTNAKLIGKAIIELWKENSGKGVIDPKVAVAKLAPLLDLVGPRVGNRKKKDIVIDVIVDQDIDDNTRMIWLALPVPDVDIDTGSGQPVQTWEDYANSISDDDAEKLGEAVLFGCGR